MKKLLLISLLAITACTQKKEQPPIAHQPANEPVTDECILLAQLTDPQHPKDHPIQLCFYTYAETRGIYTARACVGVLIEGQTGTRHPFYGSKGHWGIEGNCEANAISKKLKDPETMKTVNPISDIKMKRKRGQQLSVLEDKFGLAETLLAVTKP
jgi:hypothetical protein